MRGYVVLVSKESVSGGTYIGGLGMCEGKCREHKMHVLVPSRLNR